MPFCEVSKYQTGPEALRNNGIKIFYRTFGRGPIKVLMIIGTPFIISPPKFWVHFSGSVMIFVMNHQKC